MRLLKRSNLSYSCDDTADLVHMLRDVGYGHLPIYEYEQARLVKDRSIIVIYESGAVLIQGRDLAAGHAAVATWVTEPAEGDVQADAEAPF